MIKSIQQFQTKGGENLEKVFTEYSADMTKIAEMVYGVCNNVLEFGRSLIVEELEGYDNWLRKSSHRKKEFTAPSTLFGLHPDCLQKRKCTSG